MFICRPAHWGPFLHQLQRLAANSTLLRSLKHVTPESLLPLDFNSPTGIKLLCSEWKTTPTLELNALVLFSLVTIVGLCFGFLLILSLRMQWMAIMLQKLVLLKHLLVCRNFTVGTVTELDCI